MHDQHFPHAQGGYIARTHTVSIRIERLGVGIDGMCIYSVNGSAPMAVIAAQQAREVAALKLKRLGHGHARD